MHWWNIIEVRVSKDREISAIDFRYYLMICLSFGLGEASGLLS